MIKTLAASLLLALLLLGCQSGPLTPQSTPEPTTSPTQAALPETATAAPSPRPSLTHTHLPSPSPSTHPTLTPAPGFIYHSPGPVDAPILLYHHVSDRVAPSRYVVSVDNFRSQMQYLAQEGYQTITISDLARTIRQGGYLPEKPLVITFDDGFLDVYENAFPILQDVDFIITLYLITKTFEPDFAYGYMTPDQVSDLVSAGWEIGSHSVTHSDLKKTTLGLGNELTQSRDILEELFGVQVYSFSYPFAIANDWIRSQALAYEYDSAVGVGIGNHHTLNNLYYLSRREVYSTTTLDELKQLLILTPTRSENPPPATPSPTVSP